MTTPLPATVRDFLTTREERDTEAALRTFTTDAVVTDDGRTYRGTDRLRDFLAEAGTEFTFTTEIVGTESADDTHWVVTHHLEGDFPGGVVDLDYRFALDGDLIAGLDIVPR